MLQTLTMEAMVLGPQALLSAAMNPVLPADFSPVPVALQRRKPDLQGLKTAVAVLRGSPLVKLPHELLLGEAHEHHAARTQDQRGAAQL